MISAFLIAVVAAASACRDTVQDHFDVSVFKDKDPAWWNHQISWRNGGIVYFKDAWHLFKSIEILGIGLAVITYKPMLNPVVDLIVYLLIWGVVFELLYSKFLLRDAES